jgi:DNA-binding transcriptional ArsR family regulator
MEIKISDTFKKRLLQGLKESEFKELGLSRNPFIPFIPQEIMGTFVNREEEKKLLIRYLPELIQGFMPLLVLSGSKGIGKTHFLNYVFKELKNLEKDVGHEVRFLENDSFKEFFQKVSIGEINKPQLVLIDDTEKIWENYKQEFVQLIDSNHNVKFICVWNQSKWAQIKNDSFYSSLKPACIKMEKLTNEHLIKIVLIRITPLLLVSGKHPFSDEALKLLANLSDGVPYSMVYFSEKLLHYALDKDKKYIDETLTKEFIETLQLRQFSLSSLTRSQWKILKTLVAITNSKKRGATATEIADEMEISRPAVVMHLTELKSHNMIEENIEDKKKYYYIKPIILGQVEMYLSEGEIL